MLIYDETIRVLNEDWAYIAREFEQEIDYSWLFTFIQAFMRDYEEYVGEKPSPILDEMSIIKRPAWEYNGVMQKPSLVMKFKRYEGDGL